MGTLRVLLVEDSENDAILLLRELRRGGYQPIAQMVYTAEGMEVAIRAAEKRDELFQVVISDYYMPRFRAPDALRLLRELGYDVPFIVVSGKIGEDAAVEIMKAGANDYRPKENMSRLCPAIERELREAEVRRERERAEKALGRSEDRFRRLVEQAADAIFVHDLEGKIVDVNRQACESLGYSREELLSMSVSDIEANYAQGSLKKLWGQITSGPPCTLDGIHRRKDGTTFPVEVRVGVFEAEEHPLMLALIRDVSERREAERKIRETEARYRTLVEQIPAVTYVQEPIESDNPKAVTYMSPRYETVLGYPREAEILDEEHWLRTLHPEDRERVLAEEVRTDESGKPFKIEYRVIAADDRVVWVRDHAVLMRDKEGQPLYWLGVQFDVSEQKRVEAALRQSEELYRTVLEQAAENIFLVDVETKRVLEANAAMRRSLGYAPEELEDLTLYDIVAHDRQSVDQNTQRIIEEGQRYLGERRYRRKNGSLVDVEVSASAIIYDGGEAMSIVAHDITERKWAEESLRQSLSVLLALRQAGQILSSTLSSEEIVSRLLEIMRGVSNLTAAVISVPDQKGNFRIWQSDGLDALWVRARFSPEAEAARQAALTDGEQHLFHLPRPGASGEWLAGLCLPLGFKEQVIGVLEAYGPESLADTDMVEI